MIDLPSKIYVNEYYADKSLYNFTKGSNLAPNEETDDTRKTPNLNVSSYSPSSFSDLSLNLNAKQRPKIGLVLSGGGFEGLAHLGVIRSLIQHNIPIDSVSGTSIGSIIGAIYCSRDNWTLEEWDKVIEKMQNLDLIDLLSTPNISASAIDNHELALQKHDRLEELIKSFITVDNFEQLSKPLSVVATSLPDGEKKVFTNGNLVEALLASSSLPLIYPPVHTNNGTYIDGGFVENVPTEEAKAQYIITSDVTTKPVKNLKSWNPIKLALNLFNWIQNFNVGNSLKLSHFTFHVKQDGKELSLEDCKKHIEDSYINTENEMPRLIQSIKKVAQESAKDSALQDTIIKDCKNKSISITFSKEI